MHSLGKEVQDLKIWSSGADLLLCLLIVILIIGFTGLYSGLQRKVQDLELKVDYLTERLTEDQEPGPR